MRLSSFFKQLTYGELAHIAIGGSEKGEINPNDYERVVFHINLGLTALHTRFLLREEEVVIQKQLGMTEYRLHSDYAVSNTGSAEPFKYILDSTDAPFQDNILKIEEVYDEEGISLPLNDGESLNSIYTPRYDLVQIPYSNTDETLSVIYRASHSEIVATAATDIASVQIQLHPSFTQALLYYVASRILVTAGTDNGGNEGDNYYAKYEAECMRLERLNIDADSNTKNTRLERAGWV